MSNYSHALKGAIDKEFDGKQVALANRADVPQSLLSRHCSGNFRPDPGSLEKICGSFSPESCAEVAAAHLHDETPRGAKDLVQISTRVGARTAYVLHDERRSPAFTRLDPETQNALEIIAAAALHNEHAREAILNTAHFISGDPIKPRSRRPTRPVGIKAVDQDKLNES